MNLTLQANYPEGNRPKRGELPVPLHRGAHRPADIFHQRRFSSNQFKALKSLLAHTVVDPGLVSCYG